MSRLYRHVAGVLALCLVMVLSLAGAPGALAAEAPLLTVTSAVLQSITVTPVNPNVAAGTNQQFTATGTYSDASTADLTAIAAWASDNAAATVNQSGLATGLTTGSATISATAGSITGQTTLTVTPAVLQSITVTPVDPSIAAGTNEQFTATGTYSDASTADLTARALWASDDRAVARVNQSGLATGTGAGAATISATYASVAGQTTLTVTSGAVVCNPDASIRTRHGSWMGTGICNSDGQGQTLNRAARPRHLFRLWFAIQNNGEASDAFTVLATGSAVDGYRVEYFHRGKNITSAVADGTYTTASLAPGASYGIRVVVRVTRTAAMGSQVQRLLTMNSIADHTQLDAVGFIGMRA